MGEWDEAKTRAEIAKIEADAQRALAEAKAASRSVWRRPETYTALGTGLAAILTIGVLMWTNTVKNLRDNFELQREIDRLQREQVKSEIEGLRRERDDLEKKRNEDTARVRLERVRADQAIAAARARVSAVENLGVVKRIGALTATFAINPNTQYSGSPYWIVVGEIKANARLAREIEDELVQVFTAKLAEQLKLGGPGIPDYHAEGLRFAYNLWPLAIMHSAISDSRTGDRVRNGVRRANESQLGHPSSMDLLRELIRLNVLEPAEVVSALNRAYAGIRVAGPGVDRASAFINWFPGALGAKIKEPVLDYLVTQRSQNFGQNCYRATQSCIVQVANAPSLPAHVLPGVPSNQMPVGAIPFMRLAILGVPSNSPVRCAPEGCTWDSPEALNWIRRSCPSLSRIFTERSFSALRRAPEHILAKLLLNEWITEEEAESLLQAPVTAGQ